MSGFEKYVRRAGPQGDGVGTVNAMQWHRPGDHPEEIARPGGGPYPLIRTIQGTQILRPRIWILEAWNGRYLMRTTDFRRKYIAAGDPAPASREPWSTAADQSNS